MSQASGDQIPPKANDPASPAEASPAATDGGSWPPMPPPLINRLVSSVTATPFVPEEKRPSVPDTSFSCVIEPPPKRDLRQGASGEGRAPQTRSIVPTSPVPVAPGAPTVVPTRRVNTFVSEQTAPAAPMATVPPFAQGGTPAPFAASDTSGAPLAFNPEKPERVRWLSWSTLLLAAGCAVAYFYYQRLQRAPLVAPDAAAAVTPAAQEKSTGAGGAGSLATPFTALKQAKATIQGAGEKHRTNYELVEKMLDDPNATAPLGQPSAPTPDVVRATQTDVVAPLKRDAITALLGRDGEFFVPPGSPKPSLAFARWLRSVKIGGTRLNDRPRVLVGTTAFTFGDVVELNLGIVLDGYNAERRALRFRESSTGAVIERRL